METALLMPPFSPSTHQFTAEVVYQIHLDSFVSVGGLNDIKREEVPTVFAAIDALVIILFLLMLFTLGRAEMDYVHKAQKQAP
jgi:hypothetical protein